MGILVAALIGPCPVAAETPGAAPAAILVIDADTVEQAGERWRLVGLDAPEIHRARCPEERRRGILAAARLIVLLGERGGRLEATGRKDKYGRRLGRLMLGPAPGEDWAAIAVAEGHAVRWDGTGKLPGWCGRE